MNRNELIEKAVEMIIGSMEYLGDPDAENEARTQAAQLTTQELINYINA